MPFIAKLEKKYGKIGNLWLMDRGVPTEKTLKMMREGGYKYLVGSPRGHVKVLGKTSECIVFRHFLRRSNNAVQPSTMSS